MKTAAKTLLAASIMLVSVSSHAGNGHLKEVPRYCKPTPPPVRCDTGYHRPFKNQNRTYVVKRGDSFFSLAERFGVSAWDLRRVNHSRFSLIHVGQVLTIPAPASPWSLASL